LASTRSLFAAKRFSISEPDNEQQRDLKPNAVSLDQIKRLFVGGFAPIWHTTFLQAAMDASTQGGPSMNESKAGIGHSQRRWFGLILPLPMVPTATQAAGEHYDVAVGFALALCVYLAFMFYVIPALIAWDRRHPAAGMIWAFTLLLGWTGVGWLLALIWAFKAPGAARR
jgi:hypothetical protein